MDIIVPSCSQSWCFRLVLFTAQLRSSDSPIVPWLIRVMTHKFYLSQNTKQPTKSAKGFLPLLFLHVSLIFELPFEQFPFVSVVILQNNHQMVPKDQVRNTGPGLHIGPGFWALEW